MSSIGSNDQERFHSDLLKRQGRALSLEALLTLDQEAVRWEREKETEIAEKAKYIEHLERDLESTKDKLKRLVESRFKSVERELAMSDSKLAETYDTLIGEIKTLVLNLTKKLDKVDGSVKNLLHLMGQSKQYQKRLQNILEPNVSTQQFVGLLEQSKTPTKLLAFVLRAIVMNMLRLKLFNSNVFLCVGGKNWKQLRGVYRHLLSAGVDPNGKEPEILVAPGDDRERKDASLWRSQTLLTLDRNKDRLALRKGQIQVLQELCLKLEDLLGPLVMSTSDRDSLRVDIKRVVDSAADLSLSLGKQRAMFELEPKRYIGHSYDPKIMDSVGPWAAESDDDQPGPGKPAEILAVIIPALYKFGNDDGDEFDKFRVVRHPEVLVLPVKGIEGSLANNDSSNLAPVNTEEPPTTTEGAPLHVTEEGTTGAVSAEPSQVGQEVSKDEPPPPPPKEELSTEPKCLVEELEAHKARLGEPKAIRVPKSRHSTSGSSKTGKS